MKKIILLLFISCQILACLAQSVQNNPTKKEWTTYFYSKLGHIQTKLYTLALEGKIKAYQTDSLTSYFGIEHLKYRGSNKYSKYLMGIDDYPDSPLQLLSPKNIQCIWFIQKTNTSIFEINQETSLTGIALVYQPATRMGLTLPHPLMNIAISDLKAQLNSDEFSFIILLYNYSLQSNVQMLQNVSTEDDPFYFFNVYPSSQFVADNILVQKLAAMMSYSPFFTNEILNKHPEVKTIVDQQTQKLISFKEFAATYYKMRGAYTPAGIVNNKQVFRDTMIKEPLPLIEVSSLEMADGKASGFNYILQSENNTPLKFSVSFPTLKKHQLLRSHIWFLEDYFSWKSGQ